MTARDALQQTSQGFISYTRKDNDAFRKVVDQLYSDITNIYEARTGRELDLFLDRESIGWGVDWRQKISESVESATMFIPIVTMRYFASDPCKEELLAFHESAERLGVQELVLPIVLMGAENIGAEDPRPEVQLIERLNYKRIDREWRQGYDSPAWLGAVDDIVTGLIKSLEAAEDRLASPPAAMLASPERADVQEHGQDDASGDLSAIGVDLEDLPNLLGDAKQAIVELGDAGRELQSAEIAGLSPKQRNAYMFRVATKFSGPARNLERIGSELEERIGVTDAQLRSVVGELKSINHESAKKMLDDLLSGLAWSNDLSDFREQTDGLVGTLKMASVTNVAVRKALAPAINGIRSVQSVARIFESWQRLAGEQPGDSQAG